MICRQRSASISMNDQTENNAKTCTKDRVKKRKVNMVSSEIKGTTILANANWKREGIIENRGRR